MDYIFTNRINSPWYAVALLGLIVLSQTSCFNPPPQPTAPSPYCTPGYGYVVFSPYYDGGCYEGDEINNVQLQGEMGTSISNPSSGCSMSVWGYGDFTDLDTVDLIQGSTYDITIATDYYSPTLEYTKGWIDYNKNGTFGNGEDILAFNFPSTGTKTVSFTVPTNASVGYTMMRLRLTTGVSSASSIDPCAHYDIGEAEDYMVRILPMAPPNNAGVDSLINPLNTGDFCSGEKMLKIQVSNLGNNSLHNVNFDWELNGVRQTGQSLTFNPLLDSIISPNHDTVLALGYVNFPYNTPVHIKAWTSMPNSVSDTDPTDDTLNVYVTAHKQGVVADISPHDTAICSGDDLILDAGSQASGVTYHWSTGATTRTILVHQTGNYQVILKSLQNCIDTDMVAISVYPHPAIGDFGIVDQGNGAFVFTPVRMENIEKFVWGFGDGDTSIVFTPTPQVHHYTQTGIYNVTLTVGAGCNKQNITLSKQVFYEANTTGISNVKILENAIRIFPNPSNDLLTLKVKYGGLVFQNVTIYNVSGEKVFSKEVKGSEAQISVTSLASGVYQLQVRTNKGVINRKLEVKH